MNGLVGSRSVVNVTIGGIHHESLIDSGSQVTTISKSFHDTYLSSHPVYPLDNIIEVEGAAGQRVPYIGYIEVDIIFPENFVGRPKTVTTLALIVPDYSAISVLIGTNALDVLYEGFDEGASGPVLESCAYAVLVKHLRSLYKSKSADSDRVGVVKLLHKKAVIIPPGQKMVLDGFANEVNSFPEAPLLVDFPSRSLPNGLTSSCYIMSSPRHTSFKVPVLLKNETAHDITVPAHCTLADLTAPLSVSPLTSLKDEGRTGSRESPSAGGCHPEYSVTSESPITFDFSDSPLSEEWKERIREKLNSIPEVFARDDLDYGHTTAVKHKIRLSDSTPFKQRVRPIHPSDYEAVRLHLRELYDANIIRESESPFASPVVIVKKKSGKIRLCIDYRKLNSQTIRDAYALPNIEEAFAALTGSKWFSVMDLKSGFYQVEMEEEDKPKTAFVTPMGFWEFNRMPQGVTNAPSTFQRVMEKCMSSLNLKEVLVFLDNLIVFSETLEQHEERLMRVLNRLKEFGLKLSPEKCHFFRKSVKYLGHVVSENGVEIDPDKISALTTWPRPNNIRELKSFLGFTGYYRRFIKDFSKIAKPLNELTAGYIPAKKKNKIKSFSNADLKSPFADRWTPKCELAFRTLIEKLTTAPILGFANSSLPYILHTDASLHGLGAALYQQQDGQTKVIAYASRGLSKCERRYPTHKLEFLALKWAITDKLSDYLYGAEFTVVTDNNPLTYVLSSAKLDAAGHRWLAALSNFNFSIQYRAGKRNQDADGLSRRPHDCEEADLSAEAEDNRVQQFLAKFLKDERDVTFPQDAVEAVCQRHNLEKPSNIEEENRVRQKEDREVQLMLRVQDQLVIDNAVLYRKRISKGDPLFQLVLPKKYRGMALEGLHDLVGHTVWDMKGQ